MNLILQDYAGIDGDQLIDSTLRVRGVCSTAFNKKRQFVGIGLFVPERTDVDVVLRISGDPFRMPAIAVREALQFGQGQHRVKVVGTATYQVPGEALYLQNGNDGIMIESRSKVLVEPGARVEALGFPARGEYSPILKDGLFRIVGEAGPVRAQRIEADGVIGQRADFNEVRYDEQLVQTQGTVVETLVQAGERVWMLRAANAVFEAHLPWRAGEERLRDIGVGSVLSLTGICAVQTDRDRNPVSFRILLRSAADVAVVKQAPWWTPARIGWLLLALATAMLMVTLWVVELRHRVKQQTQTIRESEERYRHLAQHDGLTGLPNRNAVLSALEAEIARCHRENGTLTVVLADIDRFKWINDTYGHPAGDAALRGFAEALMACVRPYDHAGRYGGEEFLLVMSGITEEDIEERLNRLHACLSNLVVQDAGREFPMTCSLGAVFIEVADERVTAQSALLGADRALYEAKEAGRNRLVYHRHAWLVEQ